MSADEFMLTRRDGAVEIPWEVTLGLAAIH
jgi:hypothetical protein